VTTEKTLTILVNVAGGKAMAAGNDLVGALERAFEASGHRADVRLLKGEAMADAVADAARNGRVIVAGGDGTMACAAQALGDGGAELALLPLGTLNHLARDLGIPDDLDKAASLAATGTAIAIDVGEVNGRRFVNNASIGLYPFMVRQRDSMRRRKHWPKWLATVPAAWAALARLPHHRLRIEFDGIGGGGGGGSGGGGERDLVTPMLFVGNNRYTLEGGEIGSRATLTDGLLSVYALAPHSRAALLWFALRTLFGRIDWKQDFIVLGECPSLTVRSAGASIELALDGEVIRLESPLRFRIRAGALHAVAP